VPNYRRASANNGSTFFFTVNTYRRRSFLVSPECRDALRKGLQTARKNAPFSIEAWVLLPDHLHCIWTLPDGDGDFSRRWNVIKTTFSSVMKSRLHRTDWARSSGIKHRDLTIWQRRFWEHCVRDDNDFRRHVDYIHFNPVKHGVAAQVSDWPYSTFHRYCSQGVYPQDWAGRAEDDTGEFGE